MKNNNCEIGAERTLCTNPFGFGGSEQCKYWAKHIRKTKQFSKVCYFHVAGGYCTYDKAIRNAMDRQATND